MLQAPTRGQPQSRRLVLVRTSCWQQLPACSKAGGKLWRDKGGEESWGAPAPAAAMQGGSTGPFPSQLNWCWGTRGNGAAGGDLCKLGLLHFYGHHQLLTALVFFYLHSTIFSSFNQVVFSEGQWGNLGSPTARALSSRRYRGSSAARRHRRPRVPWAGRRPLFICHDEQHQS